MSVAANSKGRLATVTDGSGSTTYAYDAQGRVTTKTQVAGAVTSLVRYGYNAAGQLATLTTPSNQTVTYGYANNQIVSVTVNGVPVVSNASTSPSAKWRAGPGATAAPTAAASTRTGASAA